MSSDEAEKYAEAAQRHIAKGTALTIAAYVNGLLMTKRNRNTNEDSIECQAYQEILTWLYDTYGVMPVPYLS